MNKVFSIIEKFAPEAVEIMQIRYEVLRQVLYKQPIGRRQLCKELGLRERLIRGEIELLRARGAVEITQAGIGLTPFGEGMLNDIDEFIPSLFNTRILAEQIKKEFDLEQVIVVPGDSFKNPDNKKDMGRAAGSFLQKSLFPGCIVAVTGGTTLAEMVTAIGGGIDAQDVLVVPARGGLGEEMEQQAGTIAARIAKAIGAQYRLLHVPDNLEETTAEILKNDAHIIEVVNIIKASNILFHGIGSAIEMANRRGLTPGEIEFLLQRKAVGEMLRYYFDKQGKIVYEVAGIGLELSNLKNINTIVAVAGGSNKASAIEAVLRSGQQNVLITDEGAAKGLLKNKVRKDDINGS